MSALLLNLVSDWLTRRSTEDQPRGIHPVDLLEDVDFANYTLYIIPTANCKRGKSLDYSDAIVFDKSTVFKIFSSVHENQSFEIPPV